MRGSCIIWPGLGGAHWLILLQAAKNLGWKRERKKDEIGDKTEGGGEGRVRGGGDKNAHYIIHTHMHTP